MTIAHALLLVALGAAAQQPPPMIGCPFSIHQPSPDFAVDGPSDILSRAARLEQPGSPVTITRADFSGTELTVAGSAYTFSGPVVLELMNVSDQPVHDVRLLVSVRWTDHSGGGGRGVAHGGPLEPGERALVTLTGGRGTGSSSTATDVHVLVSVQSVTIGDCTYEPARVFKRR